MHANARLKSNLRLELSMTWHAMRRVPLAADAQQLQIAERGLRRGVLLLHNDTSQPRRRLTQSPNAARHG